jgi:tRNA A-37 threonylcarbamoyl transferase component Bud32
LAACQDVLQRLHALGIKRGDIDRFNFLVREGKAFLVDFEVAEKCNAVEELNDEYGRLGQSLLDTSSIGGAGPATASNRMPE